MAITITPSRHVVEWYRTELTDASVAAMAVPSDEVLYAVFAASSTDVVVDLCRRAVLPAERVTADVNAPVHPEVPG